jgi:hypothetical protein
VALALEELAGAARLVPVHGDRYIPGEPDDPGNPVLGVPQIVEAVHAGQSCACYG